MSADNGIYILETPAKPKHQSVNTFTGKCAMEYRVKHLQAIENVEWDDKIEDYTTDEKVLIKNARQMWQGCKVFTDEKESIIEAKKIANDIGYVEYGIGNVLIMITF